jgi:putative methyltransferase
MIVVELTRYSAAPGNKTSYISALMGDKGKVSDNHILPGPSSAKSTQLYAFEKSHLRYKTLEKMLSTAQCRNVQPRRADFTESDPKSKEFAKVTRM